ncbi:MAG: RnfABCDGE type electron transport complex subunit G [Clostridiales bacterium]|nr:RnfABCDGE type electron transport complex subunit G [Clostridiales bacterium]
MSDKKNVSPVKAILKDAFILFAITLIAGLALGFTNEKTKDAIANQGLSANLAAYEAVYPDAENYSYESSLTKVVEESIETFKGLRDDYGLIVVNEILEAQDASETVLGNVISIISKDGYGGNITFVIGIDLEGTIKGVEITEHSETNDLGSKITEDEFKSQYTGKNVDSFVLTKTGASADNEIDAVSGATISSNAANNAINAALYIAKNLINQ